MKWIITLGLLMLLACTGKKEIQGDVINDQQSEPVVVMETSLGTIEVALFQERAPVTVNNFLAYVDSGFYDGTIFHRVIEGFMVQGGGFTPDLRKKPTKAPIKNEADNGLSNKKYTLAMARTPVVDSATAQFFINGADNAFLDHVDDTPKGYGYAVFGRVEKGQDVVDAISRVKTAALNSMLDVPVEPVIIEKAYRK